MAKSLSVFKEGGACDASPALHLTHSDGKLLPRKFRGRAAVVTLGCAKNQVDSEVMLGVLEKSGFEIVNDLSVADVAVVNTCGFLESAVKESIDCILDVAEHKKTGQLKKLIMAGCAVERYKGNIRQELPEVDEFLAINDLLQVGEAASGKVSKLLDQASRPYFLYDDTMPRHLSTLSHTAYVKISEGCNRPCTFCIIPKIRGEMRSRSIESVLREVQELGSRGVKEVNLIAQDLTNFGVDHKSGNLTQLLTQIDQTKAVDWVRLLYAYPIGIDQELLRTMVGLESVCNYLDLPLQHSSERVLKEMKRPIGRYAARRMLDFIKKTAPEIALRTTFIVGFPGETEEDIRDLESFVSEGHFSSVGVFTYSQEAGTPAAVLSDQVDDQTKKERRERVMLAQKKALTPKLQSMLGAELEVLVEGVHPETELLLTARTYFQAPEVDGSVIINEVDPKLPQIKEGAFAKVVISEVAEYDLIGRLVA